MSVVIKSGPSTPKPQTKPAALNAPKISIGSRPLGPDSNIWVGVGTHSNPSVFERPKHGEVELGPGAIANGEQEIANLHPQITRIRVDPTILQLQQPEFQAQHPADCAAASKRLVALQHLVKLATAHGGRADLCLWDLPKGYRTSPAEMKQIAGEYATLVKSVQVPAHGVAAATTRLAPPEP